MKILLVDDDMSVRNCMRMQLEARGHDVYTVENGREAIAFLRSWSCDLVLTDYQMPLMDGVTLAKHVIAGFHKPVVMMSGDDLAQRRLKTEGIDIPFLKKPFRGAELDAAISAAVKSAEAIQ